MIDSSEAINVEPISVTIAMADREAQEAVARERRREVSRRASRAHQGARLAHGPMSRIGRCGDAPRPVTGDKREGCPTAGYVHVHQTAGGELFFAGFERCYNPAGCAICALTVASHLADCVATSVVRWKAGDRTVLLVTITLRHDRRDGLAEQLAVLDGTLDRLLVKGRNRPAARLMRSLRMRHNFAAFETPWSDGNGWNAHVHLLLYLDRPELSDAEMAELRVELAPLVVELQVLAGWRRGLVSRVLDVQQVPAGRENIEQVARYVAKAGLEVVAGVTKESRGEGAAHVFELQAELADVVGGDSLDVAMRCPQRGARVRLLCSLIREHADAFYGRVFVRVNRAAYEVGGPGWWDALLPEVAERSSKAIVEAGRKLEASDRRMLREAVREFVGESDGDGDGAGDDGDQGADDEPEPVVVAAIEPRSWNELQSGLRRRCRVAGAALVPAVVRAVVAAGPVRAVAELIEQFGVEDGLRMVVAATCPDPPPLWRDEHGVVIVSRSVPDDAVWQPVELWRGEAAA